MQSPITTLYLFQRLSPSAMGGAVFDSSKPAKFWERPIGSDDPTDDYIYKFVDKNAAVHTHVITFGDAASVNIPPDGSTPLPFGEVPFPVRDLKPGESIQPAGLAAFGAAPVVVTADPVVPGSQTDQIGQILDLVKKIAAKAGI